VFSGLYLFSVFYFRNAKPMGMHVCYYCGTKFDHIACVVEHCLEKHQHNILKYRQLILDEHSGTLKYQTKIHEGVVPYDLEEAGKSICVQNDSIFIFDNVSKRKRLNTPVKENCRKKLPFETHSDFVSNPGNQISDEDDSLISSVQNLSCVEKPDDLPSSNDGLDTDTDVLEELYAILPTVLRNLDEVGQKESFTKFVNLIKSGNFPLQNICYLLFLDLVEWHSCGTTSLMRYRPESMKFWQIGYRLFHGKFLRFMSGPRNLGQVLDCSSEKGSLNPLESKVNFIVPSRNNLYKQDDRTPGFYPGINESALLSISSHYGNKPLKLSVDGKKISRGKCKNIGDVDCWGYEASPTLEEKRNELQQELVTIKCLQEKLDDLEEKGIKTINEIPCKIASELTTTLKRIVRSLGLKNKALRERATSLEQAENKFKKLGGDDWKSSKYYPVICSIRVSKTEIKSQISESLQIANEIASFCSIFNNTQSLFCRSDSVDIQKQTNLNQLNKEYATDETRYICQRTEKWFQIRKSAMVTGSTCNTAVGLGKLKDQQSHVDRVMGKVSEEVGIQVDDGTKARMEFGVLHELDAIATLSGKVLPFLFPTLQYFEEGCVKVSSTNKDDFMVVSPDGSLRSSSEKEPQLMYENKCKAPSSYNPTAYYSIPHYYVTQLLSEMHAYQCKELLFTCWSLQSMTVFLVHFDQQLWATCWKE
jgi:hypothetical protein